MPQMRVIPTDKLEIDPDVQIAFAFSTVRARAMAANWMPERVGFLIVVPDGNGGYYVVDGRHRLRAGAQVGVKEWRCDVHEDVAPGDVEKKAALKLGFDRERRHVGALEHFLVRVMAGERIAIDIQQITETAGFEIRKRNGKPESGRTIGAVTALEKVYRMLGADKFRRTMQLNTHWIEDPDAANGEWLGGLALLVRDDYDQLLTPQHIAKMRSIVPAIATRHARGEVVRRGFAPSPAGSKTGFSAVQYEIAGYVRKRIGLRQRPVVRKPHAANSRKV